jgi:hypothetical protein
MIILTFCLFSYFSDMRSSKEIIVCVENGKEKLSLKRSLSLEALNKILTVSRESLKKDMDEKKKLSNFSVRIRKVSDSTGIAKRKISIQPDLHVRSTSINVEQSPRQRKVSVQPDLNVGNVTIPAEKRIRKLSIQPNMLGRRGSNVKKEGKARKMSVPANMKYHSGERVRVRKVSFINQNTGEKFAMNKDS